MERLIKNKDKFLTRHFLVRLFDRYGIVLTAQEQKEIKNKLLLTEKGVPFEDNESFDIYLKHKNIKFVAVMRSNKLVTAHPGRRMSPKKMKKLCNLGRIKKN